MSRSFAKLIDKTASVITLPLGKRQKAKALSRAGQMLAARGDAVFDTPHGSLKFFAGRGAGIASAVSNFFTDEPETLHYIDTYIQPGEVLWDIGANVGLYALYAAKRGAVVYAFEPNALNFGTLVDHVRINNASTSVKPLCIALSDENGLTNINMREMNVGDAGAGLDADSSAAGAVFSQAIVAFRADEFAATYNCWPDHIKLDVDGIEPLILAGAGDVLKRCKSLIIEIERGNADDDSGLVRMIEQAGLKEVVEFRELSAHHRNRLYTRP